MKELKETTDWLKEKAPFTPEVAIILGSGLGGLGEKISQPTSLSYSDIPHFPKTTVPGHEGKLIFGELQGKKVIAFKGRFHPYEGHHPKTVVLPVHVAKFLGAQKLIISNAAGGMNPNYKVGDLVLITDQINFTGLNPLIGENDENLGVRFPDMTEAYDKQLQLVAIQSAQKMSIELKEGVYAGLLGPSYETPAEIKMFQTLGADLVGMSTVLEVIAAAHCGLKVLAISCVTNMASGLGGEKLTHEDVKIQANKAQGRFQDLIEKILQKL